MLVQWKHHRQSLCHRVPVVVKSNVMKKNVPRTSLDQRQCEINWCPSHLTMSSIGSGNNAYITTIYWFSSDEISRLPKDVEKPCFEWTERFIILGKFEQTSRCQSQDNRIASLSSYWEELSMRSGEWNRCILIEFVLCYFFLLNWRTITKSLHFDEWSQPISSRVVPMRIRTVSNSHWTYRSKISLRIVLRFALPFFALHKTPRHRGSSSLRCSSSSVWTWFSIIWENCSVARVDTENHWKW